MPTTLRPLTLGEILDRTAEIYRSNFLLLAGISSAYAGVLLILSLIEIGAQRAFMAMHMNNYLIAVSVIGVVVLWLVIFVAGGIAIAANTRAVGWLHLGEGASIGAAYRAVLPRTGRFLWLMTITYFLAWFPCAVVYGAYAALIYFYVRPKGLFSPGTPPPSSVDPQVLIILGGATLAFVFLVTVFAVYGVIMSLRYSLAIPACAVEDLKARAAIRRSIQLSKGARGRIFMLGLLAGVIQIGLIGITQGFFIFAGVKNKGIVPVWMSVVQQLLAFLTNSFVGPIYATGFTLFYYDQRVRKEGFDIEHMMKTAGMTGTPRLEDGGVDVLVPAEPGSGHE